MTGLGSETRRRFSPNGGKIICRTLRRTTFRSERLFIMMK
jgi:hypothetical protein